MNKKFLRLLVFSGMFCIAGGFSSILYKDGKNILSKARQTLYCNASNGCNSIVYKVLGSKDGGGGTRTKLHLDVFAPLERGVVSERNAVVVLFPGGGWRSHERSQFYQLCNEIVSLDATCISVEYRVSGKDHSNPLHSLEDAHDALHYICMNSSRIGISEGAFLLGGISAGGHIAASVLLAEFPQYQIKPLTAAGLILLNPVIDNSVNGYGHERIRHFFPELSPMYTTRLNSARARGTQQLPPILYIVGDNDAHTPLTQNEVFYQKWEKHVSDTRLSKLVIFKNQGHGVLRDKYQMTSSQILSFIDRVEQQTPCQMD